MRESYTVAIHQPNFFPWMGYFNKIAKSNIFIFLDHVQHEKSDGTWSNRVKFLIDGNAKWITAPINRNFKGTEKLLNIYFSKDYPWRKKFYKSIIFNYKRHDFFEEYIEVIEKLIFFECDNLSQYNINLITQLSKMLNLNKTKFFRSSNFNIDKKSNELLVALIKKVGADIYLSGGGSGGYLKEEIFKANDIILKKQQFKAPIYNQRNTDFFVPNLSILDSIFNVGLEKTRDLIFNS